MKLADQGKEFINSSITLKNKQTQMFYRANNISARMIEMVDVKRM